MESLKMTNVDSQDRAFDGENLPSLQQSSCRSLVGDGEGPLFSLLVATVGRQDVLVRLLESLASQSISKDSFEVLIADQNPPGFLQPILTSFPTRLRLRVVSVPNRGVSQARNALLPLATGSYITFPDDDCVYEKSTLQEALNGFESLPHVHVILARWTPHGQCGNDTRLKNAPRNWLSVFKRGETYVQFYRREAVLKVGAFDPRIGSGTGLPYGGSEDTDYLLRAAKAGFSIMFVPKVLVHHKGAEMTKGLDVEKIRSYAIGRMYLLHKHRLPLWFQVANILYPLARLPLEGFKAVPYRWKMFMSRWRGFFYVRKCGIVAIASARRRSKLCPGQKRRLKRNRQKGPF